MAFDSPPMRAAPDAAEPAPRVLPFVRPARSWLARLGPVLLVREAGMARRARCACSCEIDSFGVREVLHLDGARIYRLADSDYFGWEYAATHRAEPSAFRLASRPGVARAARVVRSCDGEWIPVTQLSALGWEQVREILRYEGARLAPGSQRAFDPATPRAPA